ncbi:MAG TPA: hypothetical protein VLE02_01410 [Nitrosarchaeum sp.]|nr:hypothetical protein [Nitrosarchaeum sp.]
MSLIFQGDVYFEINDAHIRKCVRPSKTWRLDVYRKRLIPLNGSTTRKHVRELKRHISSIKKHGGSCIASVRFESEKKTGIILVNTDLKTSVNTLFA